MFESNVLTCFNTTVKKSLHLQPSLEARLRACAVLRLRPGLTRAAAGSLPGRECSRTGAGLTAAPAAS